MSGIVAIKRSIRRALQTPLYDAVLAAGYILPNGEPAIRWPGVAFEREGLLNYFDAEIVFGAVTILEIGPTPQVRGDGAMSIVTRSPLKAGEDGNDKLTGIIASAYPYASTPAFAGVEVCVDKMEPGGYGSDGPWTTGLTRVYWNVYRRP